MRVMMVGATGRHAHLVLEELLRRGVWVRALVRSPQSALTAKDRGAHDAVVADLTKPHTLGAAVAGMDGVFHIGPGLHGREAAMGTALVDASRVAGVAKFVFSGVIHPSIAALSNHSAKLPVEDALYSSGMNFTVLQPARFMQALETYWDVPRDELAMPYSITSAMSWVDYRDVAEVAATALTSDQLSYGTFELSAPGAFDGTETAAILSEVTGRTITAVHTPASEFARRLPVANRAAFIRMMAYYDKVGLPAGNSLILRQLLGREPRTVRSLFCELNSSTPVST